MIRPWIFEFANSFGPTDPEAYDPAAAADDLAWYQRLWVEFEAIGFEGIFFSEHHFRLPSLAPSPNLLIAALAARTRTLRLGTMGNVVTFYEPWRLAEEFGMLDLLSGGRLEIGLASGVGPMEFRAIGMTDEEMRPRFAEALDVLDAALTQPRFTHRGQRWKFDGLSIVPRPLQRPTPRRWMTGLGRPTAELAASRGCCFCTGFMSVARVQDVFAGYREAAAAAGHEVGSGHLGLRRQVLLGDDAGAVRELAGARLRGLQSALAGLPPPKDARVADAPAHGPLVGDEESIAGTPAEVAGQIIDQCRRTGAGHFLAYLFAGFTREQVWRSYELWREVIPRLRAARIGT